MLTPDMIEAMLLAEGPGARGLVYVEKGPDAHVFNAVNNGSQVLAIDGQQGIVGTIGGVIAQDRYTGAIIGFSQTWP